MYDELDEEQNLTRESFARFGLAMYHAQCLERSLAILHVLGTRRSDRISRSQLDYEIDYAFSHTYGQLLQLVADSGLLHDENELMGELSEAKQIRDRLAHDYWWQHAISINHHEGKKLIIQELEGIIEWLSSLDDRVSSKYETLYEELGIDSEMIESRLEEMIATKDTTVEKKPRPLRKNERVLSLRVLRASAASGNGIGVFEMDAGTLWTLGDRGLIYAPTDSPAGRHRPGVSFSVATCASRLSR